MYIKKQVLLLIMLVTCVLISCSSRPAFIVDENGNKKYKDKEGNYVKDAWVEVSGGKYYFDLNGNLITNKWVENEYYVDSNGKMATNYWYDDGNGNLYFLSSDGKYARNCIMNIEGKEYGFDSNGKRAKNIAVKDGEKSYFFGNDFLRDKEEGWKNNNGIYLYVNNTGDAIINDWFEIEGKWYYFDENGILQTNTFINDFYVDENGEMVCNKEISIGNDKYIFDAEGHGKVKETKKIDFNELYKKYFYHLSVTGEKSYIYTKVKVSNDGKTLEIEPDYWYESGIIECLTKMNRELNIPSSLVSRIKATKETDGMQTEKYGNISVSWNAKEEYNKGWNQWQRSHWIYYNIE